MTRNDALEALDRLHANAEYNGCLADFRAVKQALTAQPSPDFECVQKMHELELPDVEALREDVYAEVSRCCIGVISPSDAGYGAKLAFDYLVSRNLIAQAVQPIEGLDDAIKSIDGYSHPKAWDEDRIYIDAEERYLDALPVITKAARAYAALQRGKVDIGK